MEGGAPLDRFNAAEESSARQLLLSCAAVPRWADEILAHRPYADVEAVLAVARSAAEPWTPQEVDAALARHPRIGERPRGEDADAAHSRREQAGLGGDDPDVLRRIEDGNRAYEQRFGHVFLIRAAGRSGAEILAELERRMGNDPAAERRVAAEQLREIAVLRLRGELS